MTNLSRRQLLGAALAAPFVAPAAMPARFDLLAGVIKVGDIITIAPLQGAAFQVAAVSQDIIKLIPRIYDTEALRR